MPKVTEQDIQQFIRNFERDMAKVSPDKQPEQSERPSLIFPRITAEQLRVIAYYALSGDVLTPSGSHHHQGSPDKLDHNNLTKRMIYEAASSNEMEIFNRMEKILNTESRWLEWMVSKRHRIPSKVPGKKARPIDVPSEAKRLYGIFVLWHLTQVVKSADYLEPTVIGFRFLHEFSQFKDRDDGITIQDVFASTVFNLIRQHGQWVVLLDLEDAYGNLPHQAIQTALKELGINHKERRRLIELVRIRTIKPNGELFEPYGYGIEQGHPASPMIFNIVMSHIIQKLKATEIPMASYGDDVILVTKSELEAKDAFDLFNQITDDLGFKNVRPLGSSGKASRVYNVAFEPVPLIKTFLVGANLIGLTKGKAEELISRITTNPNLSEIRKKNKYKMVSKETLKIILENRELLNPPAEGYEDNSLPVYQRQADGGYVEKGQPHVSLDLLRSISSDDDPIEETDGMDSTAISSGSKMTEMEDPDLLRASLSSITAYHDVTIATTPTSNNSTGQPAGSKLASKTLSGRMSVLRGGSDTRVQSGGTDAGRRGHRMPASEPVLYQVTDEDWKALFDGRRLRRGDRYRGCTLDIRELADRVPEGRFHHAIAQLARVASKKGRVRILVHPGDTWVWDDALFDLVQPVGREFHERGMVIMLRRPTVKNRVPVRRKHPRQIPEDIDLAILSARRNRDNTRKWSVAFMSHGDWETVHVTTTSANRSIARLEAVSLVFTEKRPASIAMPINGLADTCLLEKKNPGQARSARPQQVGLFDAVRRLKPWKWKRNGTWLIGKPAGKPV